jgi:hypothetical protein
MSSSPTALAELAKAAVEKQAPDLTAKQQNVVAGNVTQTVLQNPKVSPKNLQQTVQKEVQIEIYKILSTPQMKRHYNRTPTLEQRYKLVDKERYERYRENGHFGPFWSRPKRRQTYRYRPSTHSALRRTNSRLQYNQRLLLSMKREAEANRARHQRMASKVRYLTRNQQFARRTSGRKKRRTETRRRW